MNPFNPILDFITNHPVWSLFIAWFVPNAVAFMPPPNGSGFLGSAAYKWIFGMAHAIPNLPRLIITMFPQFAESVKLITPAQSAQVQSNKTT